MDLSKPLFQATLGDFKEIMSELINDQALKSEGNFKPIKKHYVYGIAGIMELFSCSKPTAIRIKNSGEIDDAVSQIGDIIVVDAEYALDLLKVSKKYRKRLKKPDRK